MIEYVAKTILFLVLLGVIIISLVQVWRPRLDLKEMRLRFLERHRKLNFSFQIVSTLAVLLVLLLAVNWIVHSQIDLRATVTSLFRSKQPKPIYWVVTRDPNKIYQDENPVGTVVGTVTEKGDTVSFQYLCETGKLQRDLPFQYRRQTLQIVNLKSSALQKFIEEDGSMRENTLTGVVCIKTVE